MMKMLNKIFLICGLLCVTFVITFVPCFAQVNYGNIEQIYYMNAYCSSISVDGCSVVNNLYSGDSDFSGSFANFDFSSETTEDSFNENIFDVSIYSQGYLENVEVSCHFVIDPFFVDKSSIDYWPSIQLNMSDDSLNSPAVTDFVINYRVINTDTQDVVSSYVNGTVTTANPLINLRNLLGSYVNDGDILEISLTTSTIIDSFRSLNISTSVASPAVRYFVGGFVQASDASFDILNFIGTTIDNFFSVQIFDGVTIGNLFLIVIAVPALLAVFRMLGGVG